MKIITCFKLVPEEQDITVTPEHSLNFDRAEAKISQFDLNAIEAAAQLAGGGDEIAALTVGGSLLQNSKSAKMCYPAGRMRFSWFRCATGARPAQRNRAGASIRGGENWL